MKINFGGTQLTDWEARMARDVTLNGQSVVEAIDIVRALAKRFYSRGNDSISLQFGARWEFDTLADAQNFYFTLFSTLPKFGLCQIICGGPGDDDSVVVSMPNAVLSSVQGGCNGVEVVLQFTIQAGEATTNTPIDFLIGGEIMIYRGKAAIASGVDTVAVVFAAAFPIGTTVIVTAGVAKPSGAGSNIFPIVRDDLVTINGFTVELSGPTPDANHKLNWAAYGT